MREPFAAALISLSGERQDLVVLDGDCSHSTRTYRFADMYPERFINAGIAEQNMIGMATGMSKAGLVPIVCGFAAIMVHRAAEQLVQSVAYCNANVKVIGHYAGFTAASEGAPHHAIADLALIRAVPNITILCPVRNCRPGRLPQIWWPGTHGSHHQAQLVAEVCPRGRTHRFLTSAEETGNGGGRC